MKFLSLILILFSSQALASEPRRFDASADISTDRIEELENSNSPLLDRATEAVAEAVFFSMHSPDSRVKLPGPWTFNFGGMANINDIDDVNLALTTNNLSAPDSYTSGSVKVGYSFPFGIATDLGFSYLASSSTKLYGMFGNLNYQAADFASLVYTDFVPAIGINAGFEYTLSGAEVWGLQGQLLLGGYHRQMMAQINYALQFSHVKLTAGSHTSAHQFVRHGVSTQWPIYEGLTLRQDIYVFPLQGAFSVGYQF